MKILSSIVRCFPLLSLRFDIVFPPDMLRKYPVNSIKSSAILTSVALKKRELQIHSTNNDFHS